MNARHKHYRLGQYDELISLYTYLKGVQGDIPSDVLTGLIKSLSTTIKFINTKTGTPANEAVNMLDDSGSNHHGTYVGTWAANQRISKGNGLILSPNGTDNYINLGDANDFSFGDGANDIAFTIAGLIEVPAVGAVKAIISKRNDTVGSELREWGINIQVDGKLILILFDGSANVFCYRLTNAVISSGFHTFVVTYSGVGGASAANGIIIYIDGSVVASTATNHGAYVAMENLASPVMIGAWRISAIALSYYLNTDFTPPIVDKGTVWTAAQVNSFHQYMKGVYNL